MSHIPAIHRCTHLFPTLFSKAPLSPVLRLVFLLQFSQSSGADAFLFVATRLPRWTTSPPSCFCLVAQLINCPQDRVNRDARQGRTAQEGEGVSAPRERLALSMGWRRQPAAVLVRRDSTVPREQKSPFFARPGPMEVRTGWRRSLLRVLYISYFILPV